MKKKKRNYRIYAKNARLRPAIIWKQITRPILAFWSKTCNFISSSIHARPINFSPFSLSLSLSRWRLYTRCVTQVYTRRIEISITRESKPFERTVETCSRTTSPLFDRWRQGGKRGGTRKLVPQGWRRASGEAALLPITWRYASLKFIRRDSPIPTLAPHEPRIIYL